MRRSRSFPVLLLVVVATACSDGPGPLTPLPDDGGRDRLALDIAGARQGVIDFLDGMARVPVDGGDQAEAVSADPSVAAFVDWFRQTLENAGGTYTGQARIDSLEVLGADPSLETANLVLDVEATVHLIRKPEGAGGVTELTADFSGLVVVLPADPDGWAVADLTYEGHPVTRVVRPVGIAVTGPDGVRVGVHSLIDLPETEAVELVVSVHNPSDRWLVLLRDDSFLQVGPVRAPFAALSRPIWLAPGEDLQTSIAVRPVAEMANRSLPMSLVLRLRGGLPDGSAATFRIPIRQDGQIPPPDAAPTPEPTAPPSGSPVPLPTSPEPTPTG